MATHCPLWYRGLSVGQQMVTLLASLHSIEPAGLVGKLQSVLGQSGKTFAGGPAGQLSAVSKQGPHCLEDEQYCLPGQLSPVVQLLSWPDVQTPPPPPPQAAPTVLHSFSEVVQVLPGVNPWSAHLLFVAHTLHGSAIAAFSLISCCCLTRINPAPRPPTKTKSPRMVAMTLFPPNFFLGWLGVTTGGISKFGAAEPESDGGAVPSVGANSGGNGGGIEASPAGISIGAGGVSETGGVTCVGFISVGLFGSGIYISDFFQIRNAKARTPTPMIDSAIVGVKLPESGTGAAVAVAVALGVAVPVAVGDGIGEAVGLALGVDVGEADGVDSKAGPSAAWTIKVLVKVLSIPLESRQTIVILWAPSANPCGELHFQLPFEGTLTDVVTGSDSRVIVIVVPEGPSPKNSGFVEVTISPSSTLSKVTVVAEGVADFSSTSNLDEGVASSGRPMEALGISLTSEGGRFLKSWVSPRIIDGTGRAD